MAPLADCSDWVSWDAALGESFDQQFFVVSAIFLSLIAVLVTNLSRVERVNFETGKKTVKYQAAGGGIAEVKTILGGFVIRGFLGFKTMVTKVIGLIFCISSGITLGQQGPLVHISCCIGNIFSRLFFKYAKNEGKRREILSAASAAGVAVAFAAPIGGVLFSLEEVSYYFPMKTMWRSFFCSLMAAMSLKVLNPYGSGKLVRFQVGYLRDWKDFELVPFALLGILGGIYGALFIRISNAWADLRKSRYYPLHPVAEVVGMAFLTAIVNQHSPLFRLSLSEVKEVLFSECIVGEEDLYGLCNDLHSVLSILWSLFAAKTILVISSNGLRVPGGIVGSSMLVGACMGRVVGVLILNLQQQYPDIFLGGSQCVATNDCVTPGIYALVGAAAALGGATRMTVSLVVVMVELTGALKLVLPLMVAIMCSKWTADSITRDSFYDTTIKRNDYPYLDHKREHHPRRGTDRIMAFAGEVAEYDPDAAFQVDVEYSWEEIQEKLRLLMYMDDGGYAVLDGQALLGYIAYQDVKHVCTLVANSREDPEDSSSNTSWCPSEFNHTFHFKDPSVSVSTPRHSYQDELNGTDLSQWMDQAPLTVSCRASMDLVLELFMKVGCKTVCVVDGARFVGVLDKKRVIAWLKEG
ncbi:hypothetical protein HDU98_012012 [Podochytrium sp. JEL0797]|nr:hypothetical protein HDU98_012012 [Podochytrium sp. JEL0797]